MCKPKNIGRFPFFPRQLGDKEQNAVVIANVADNKYAEVKFADDPEWDQTKSYSANTMVLHENALFISRRNVPAGTAIGNADYWIQINTISTEAIEELTEGIIGVNPETGNEYYTFGTRGTGTAGDNSFVEGVGNIASGEGSHAEGDNNTASGMYSHAEGKNNTALNAYSHVEGYSNTASGIYSHAEGRSNSTFGTSSHVEGVGNAANEEASHAEGCNASASGFASHAEGYSTRANGLSSHAEGQGCIANGDNSHASGLNTVAASDNQFVAGKFNISDDDDDYAFIIGNGTDEDNRSNAFAVDWDGNAIIGGEIKRTNGSSWIKHDTLRLVNFSYPPNAFIYIEFDLPNDFGNMISVAPSIHVQLVNDSTCMMVLLRAYEIDTENNKLIVYVDTKFEQQTTGLFTMLPIVYFTNES